MLIISNLSGGGGDFLKPNVSLVTDTYSLYYNPMEKELPYLTITALEDDLIVSLSLNPCQYSLNGTEWNLLQADEQTPAISSGEKIYFKAEGLISDGRNGIGTFTVSKRFNLSGNCISMLFGDEAEGKTDLTGYDGSLMNLFYNCTGLEKVSKNFLPATTIEYNSYAYMFGGCTSLVTAPELPATTLASSCYQGMFMNCTSLETLPSDFLPATTLANSCYQGMFMNCTSLETLPSDFLPATTLANSCYMGMFQECPLLLQAPELPATNLARSCYYAMFHGCTSLNYIKMLATDISANVCLDYWVDGVSSTGTFVKSKDATWNVTGKNGIPEGWTVETA